MRRGMIPFASLIALICAHVDGHAQTLPPPRVLPSESAAPPLLMPLADQPLPPLPALGIHPRSLPLPPVYYRPSAYQVWQYYGVTYSGYFRPRVMNMGNGGYFLNGMPYPWVQVYPGRQIMPFPRD